MNYNNSTTDKPTMWTTGFLSNGMRVSFTFPIDNPMEACKQALDITNKLLADGFLLTEPGLEAGELKEQVGFVSRRQKKNDDQTITPIIDVYSSHDAMKFRIISVYLNTADDITAFENASGLKVASLPLVPGKAALDKSDDSGGIVKVAQMMHVIYKANPYFDPNEKEITKMKPKHIFVRWEVATTQPIPQPTQPAAATPAPQPSEPDYAEREAEARRKAVADLDRETLTIFQTHYKPQGKNGLGNPRWEAIARMIDGTPIPLVMWTEHKNLIEKAGYKWPQDSDSLDIQVSTEVVGSERRPTGVIALDGTWMYLNGEKRANSPSDAFPAWIFDMPSLLMKLKDDPQLISVTTPERVNTIKAMHRENEFDKVSNVDSAVLMVVNRLMAHLAKREKKPA